MEEYFDNLLKFYNELLISTNDKSSKCDGCSKNKKFIINLTKNDTYQLIYSCGEIDKSECGIKYSIELPKYINFNDQYKFLNDKLNDNINFEVLNKYITIDDSQFKKDKEKYEKELNILNKIFEKINDTDKKEKEYTKLIKDRNEKYKDAEKVKYLLDNETDLEKRKEFRIEYVTTIKKIKDITVDIKNITDSFKITLLESDPIINGKVIAIKQVDEELEPVIDIPDTVNQELIEVEDVPEVDHHKPITDEQFEEHVRAQEDDSKEVSQESDINIDENNSLNILTDVNIYQKEKDMFRKNQKKSCLKSIVWKKLDKITNSKLYNEYLDKIKTNPKYKQFNQIYFHAGDNIQFQKYAMLKSRVLGYPSSDPISYKPIFDGFNNETTYQTFEYLFDKLKKGVYVSIKNNKLDTYLPFSNINYVNQWYKILEESNPELVKEISSKYYNVSDPSKWYANNCIFKTDAMKFNFSEFVQEGDKTVAIFKQFLLRYLDVTKTKINVEFFFNPRDFPVLKRDYGEPYEQIYPDKQIEEEYRHDIYTPILSQCGNNNYHDIPIPTQDDILRLTTNIFPESCTNPYQDVNFEMEFKDKKPICVFRGSATGCGITAETNMRIKACMMSYDLEKNGINILDAKLTGWNRKPKIYDGQFNQLDKSSFPKDFIVGESNKLSLDEISSYKYILNIDGHVKAFRLGNEMRMKSVVLLVNSPYTLWFSEYMKEFIHYVPIESDLSDLEEKIKWCNDNPKKCEEIVTNALDFYETYLNQENTFKYFDKLLTDLSNIRIPPEYKKNNNKLNIIVAYRDPGDDSRKIQLEVFKRQMNEIFKNRTDVHIYIIEQESDRVDYEKLPDSFKQDKTKMAKFNLGRLKNIGFHIANLENKDIENSYYVLSDVDLLPSEELIKDYLKYPKNPIHLGNIGTRYDQGKSLTFLGGVLSINEKDFAKCNGYPNNFWGWGGEDDALYQRLNKNKIKIDKPSGSVIDLEQMSLSEKNKNLKENNAKIDLKQERINDAKNNSDKNGLNDVQKTFDIIDRDNNSNISHILVFLKITEKDKEKLQEIKITDYKVGMKVSWEYNNKLLIGVINKIDKNSKKINVKEYESTIKVLPFYKLNIITDEEYKFIINQNKLLKEAIDKPLDKPDEELELVEPVSPRPDQDQVDVPVEVPVEDQVEDQVEVPVIEEPVVDKPVKPLTIKDFKKDMKVSWYDKNDNTLTGTIEFIKPRSRKNINIIDDKGKQKIIPFNKLTIIKESKKPVVEEPKKPVVEEPVEKPVVEEPKKSVVEEPKKPVVEEPVEKLDIGDNVTWNDKKTGKELTGKIKNKTMKNYIICCKKDDSTWRVPINWPSLKKK